MDEITTMNLNNVKVTKISEMKTKSTTNRNKIFLVQLDPTSATKDLTAIKRIIYQVVKWEPLKKNNLIQCKKCQRLGHIASNCFLDYRCR